jgi:hypothetical protein
MIPETALIERLRLVPHVRGRSDWGGADCWGIVCIWYRERFGIELQDRGANGLGVEGLQSGFDRRSDWIAVASPENDDVVVMRAAKGRIVLDAGHIGVFWSGVVVHSSEDVGCIAEPLTARTIRHRITGYYRHGSRA